jgi:HK97 family phage major capsid protein
MSRKLRELLQQRSQKVQEIRSLMDEGKIEEARAKKDELAQINNQIEELRAIEDELNRGNIDPGDARNILQNAQKQTDPDKDKAAGEELRDLRASAEYREKFFEALRAGITPGNIRRIGGATEEYAPLLRAISITGGTPAGSEGGFLVPADFDNMLHEMRRQFVALVDYVAVEDVTLPTGWRALESVMASVAMPEVQELGTITQSENPKFTRVDYTVKKYGDIIPISNEFLADSPVSLMNYLSRWFSRKSVLTENTAIKSILDTLVATAYDATKGIKPLKKALNVDLDPDISINSIILTNQSGWNFLDGLEDSTGRPLLQTDPTNGTRYQIKGRPVVMVSNTLMTNRHDDVSGKDYAPIYIGDLRQFIAFFRRQGVEMASTNVGAGAFETDSTKIRALIRFDCKKWDAATAVKLEVEV